MDTMDMMDMMELLRSRRTIRRFKQTPVPEQVLVNAVDAARLAPCGGNMQSLKFAAVTDPALVAGLFELSKWGMHLRDGSGSPKEGQRPTAWILILNDTAVREQAMILDIGAAAMSILLAALAEGVGGCWLEGIQRKEMGALLKLPEGLEVVSSVALGYPDMQPREVPLPESGKTPYFWGEDGSFCVPKRSLDDVMLKF